MSIPGPLSPAAAAPPLPAQPHRQSRQRLGLLGQCLHALEREQLHFGGTAAAAATTTPTTHTATAAAATAASSGGRRRHEAAAAATATDAEGIEKSDSDPIAIKEMPIFCFLRDGRPKEVKEEANVLTRHTSISLIHPNCFAHAFAFAFASHALLASTLAPLLNEKNG